MTISLDPTPVLDTTGLHPDCDGCTDDPKDAATWAWLWECGCSWLFCDIHDQRADRIVRQECGGTLGPMRCEDHQIWFVKLVSRTAI